MNEAIKTAPESESFSPAGADEALGDLMDRMSKAKKMEFFGHFNEIGVVLHKLEKLAGIHPGERHKAL